MPKVSPPEIIGSALKTAREKRGMEAAELATMCCLSTKMILELEEGGTRSFYNHQIKLSSAKRVGTFLGLSPSEYLDQAVGISEVKEPPLAPESLSTAEEANQPSELPSLKDPIEHKEISEPKSVVDQAKQLDDLIYQDTHAGSALPHAPTRLRSFKRFGSVLAALVVFGAFYALESQLDLFSQTLVFLESANSKKVAQEEVPLDNTPQEPQQVFVEEKAPEKAGDKAAPVMVAAPVQSQCPPVRDDQVPIYKSPNPSKLGDMVHIKTLVKQTICVADAQGKQTLVELEPNAAQSFKGASPFIVSAQDLDNVEIFFQGWRVRPANSGQKQVKLVEVAIQ